LKILTWLNTRRLLTVVLFLGIFVMALRAVADNDLWWHLAAGDWIRANGSVPRVDPFSHTVAGQTWIEPGWLPDVLMSHIFERFSYAGLGVLLGCLVTAALAINYVVSDAHPFVRAFATLLGAITSALYWTMRPHLFSFLFFAITLWILAQHRRGRRRVVWLLPPLMLLWANCHGAWISGLIAIACYVLGETLERAAVSDQRSAISEQQAPRATQHGSWRPLLELIAATALSLPLLAVNPHGLALLRYPFTTINLGALQEHIQEWASPNFHLVQTKPFLCMLLLVVAALALAGRRPRFADLFTLLAFTYLALSAVRHIALWALVAAPLLATYGQAAFLNAWRALVRRYPALGKLSLRESAAAPRPALAAAHWLLVLALLAAGVYKAQQPLSDAFNEKVQAEHFPAGAVAYLQSHELAGEMYNTYNWGGYLLWKLYPGRRVFIDGRTDLYGDAFIQRWQDVAEAKPGWEETLREYHVGYMIIEADSFLSRYLALLPDWEEKYRDDVAMIYARKG